VTFCYEIGRRRTIKAPRYRWFPWLFYEVFYQGFVYDRQNDKGHYYSVSKIEDVPDAVLECVNVLKISSE